MHRPGEPGGLSEGPAAILPLLALRLADDIEAALTSRLQNLGAQGTKPGYEKT